MDAGNMIKPMLARGELRMIGATTLDEYRKYVEKDPALERRFQQVYVGEPSRRGHDRHPARPQGALRGAPRRAHPGLGARRRGRALQPLPHQPLPARQGHRPDGRGRQQAAHRDRLAAHRDRHRRAAHPAARDRAGRAARRRPTPRSKERLEAIETELADAAGADGARCARTGKARRRPSRRSGSSRRSSSSCAPRSSARPTSTIAAEIRYGRIPELERHIDRRHRRTSTSCSRATAMLKEEVDAEDIAEVVSKWTGVPVTRLMEGEMAKLVHLEDAAAPAGRRPGRGRRRGVQRDPPRPRRPQRPEPADRLVHVPRPHRRRQDRARPRASPSTCSTTRRRWSASTWASTWRSSPSAA